MGGSLNISFNDGCLFSNFSLKCEIGFASSNIKLKGKVSLRYGNECLPPTKGKNNLYSASGNLQCDD